MQQTTAPASSSWAGGDGDAMAAETGAGGEARDRSVAAGET
uniref:Uncharacterized protein n=1 Tax=Arundo donax TaxID=35708 RepID=A0A0A9CC21_ARUDO